MKRTKNKKYTKRFIKNALRLANYPTREMIKDFNELAQVYNIDHIWLIGEYNVRCTGIIYASKGNLIVAERVI